MDIKTYDKKPAACNCINLRRASRAITQIYDDMLAPSGITISQYGLLSHISHLAPVSVSNLAAAIRLDRTTLVRNLKQLEEQGLVEDAAPKGTRNRQLRLSELGDKTLTDARELWLKAQLFMEEYLGSEDLNTLINLLSKIEALVP